MTNLITTTSALPTGDPRSIFARAVSLTGDVIASLQPSQMTLPTPCDEFDVRGMVGHLLTVLTRVAVLAEGGDPMAMPPSTEVDDERVVDAWRTAAHRVQLAWTDDAVLDRTMTLPWVTAPGRVVLDSYTNEVSVHTWDLARGAGAEVEWDDEVLAVAFAATQQALPATGRKERFAEVAASLPPGVPFRAPFGEAIVVADDAPLIDRLVAWTGRRP
jgi:uncharacterized protein (TIGR03086 family)